MDSVSAKEVLKEKAKSITAQQIADGYAGFQKLINNPTVIFKHTRANLMFLSEKTYELAQSADALLFPGAWVEAFHVYGHELPDPMETPAEEAARKAQEEADRIARDKADGSHAANRSYFSEEEREAAAQKRQEAFEQTKRELTERVERIRKEAAEPSPEPPTVADVILSLKQTNLDRPALVKWLRGVDSSLYLEARKLPYDKTRPWGTVIDDAIAGRHNA
jgi:hypothetical protein